jgi:hypothetical protein
MDPSGKLRLPPRALLLTALLVLAPGLPALGQTPGVPQNSYLTLSKSDCDRLARHYPADDVAYQPGRDVRGKPVAPADLDGGSNGSGLILPDAVIIPIEVDMFERFGIPANDANFKGDIFIGEVVVDVASGRATFNGQPLESDAEAELAALCQRIQREAPAAD